MAISNLKEVRLWLSVNSLYIQACTKYKGISTQTSHLGKSNVESTAKIHIDILRLLLCSSSST